MKKILLIAVLAIIIVTGCSNKQNKIYLDKNYYGTNEYIPVTKENIESNRGNYLLFVYNNACSFGIPCEEIFDQFMKQENISILSIPYTKYKETYLAEEVKYAPTIIIVNNKKVIEYLDASEDEDINRYQDVNEFKKWLENYIYLEEKTS